MSNPVPSESPAINSAQTRFFIALLPPQVIQDYAYQVIQELGTRYHTRTAKAPPHVTLQAPFLWQISMLPELEHCLRCFARTQPQIPIRLSGFGAFAPRVLFINVLKTVELIQVQKDLMLCLEQQLRIVDSVAQHRPFSPHLTVASRELTRHTFKQAWAELQQRSVEFEFMGDRLTLLIHDGHHWQVQSEFPLATRNLDPAL